ncbi:hypothetical protein KY284_000953 [Solanum tuberosum]|nr:hypothetical protein KY284_000953 [Solanum tuberosum]
MNDGCDHTSINAPDSIRAPNVVRTGDRGIEDGRDGRRRASLHVKARSVGGRLGRWEEGGV